MNESIQTIYDDEKKLRVIFFQRIDGSFGFAEEYFSGHELDMCWMPQSRNISFFDTLETALREVHGRVDWLISIGSSTKFHL
ncbi:hypothetical protein B1R32_11557 [Abditibacterium utsteinense]|uniref:Uncharacterized protein n=1 Tax=Abditibacterium utsteinense TaxID=1960156 RepID=A0A2S8SQX3_9BACT|nr:hypothetical protein [Abditibacterium utsteinense]PQV63149.1 hypothetical protein B1R32_11557 [Abditibacterium utsteinense]